MGRPKALVELDGELLVLRSLRVLADGGCAPLLVVLGAAADEVRGVLPPGVRSVVADGWESGMGASLRAGLGALSDGALPDGALPDGALSDGALPDGALSDGALSGGALADMTPTDWALADRARPGAPPGAPDAVLVHLVDLPGVTAAAVARLVAAPRGPGVLRRAAFDGRPGNPVLLGRDHWPAAWEAAVGDAGARGYLHGNVDVELVECADVADAEDVDTPEQLDRFRTR